ncbi:hypothetical protein AAEP93_001179 [Penicillium crustosum]
MSQSDRNLLLSLWDPLDQPFDLLVWMLRRAAAISPAHSKETSAETYL